MDDWMERLKAGVEAGYWTPDSVATLEPLPKPRGYRHRAIRLDRGGNDR